MDKVRLGRALGYGARHAARTLAQAVEAAAAPDPSKPTATGSSPAPDRTAEPDRSSKTAEQPTSRTKTSVFTPLKKFSKSLWLEVTGSFFTLIALFLGGAAWKQRAALSLPPVAPEAQRLYLCTAIFVVFTYFAVSSFVRARRA